MPFNSFSCLVSNCRKPRRISRRVAVSVTLAKLVSCILIHNMATSRNLYSPAKDQGSQLEVKISNVVPTYVEYNHDN